MPVKILLADKSITIQKVVEMLFSGKDYEVSCVSDGENGLGEISRFAPDVVLADVDLPRIDGYTFSARLQQLPSAAQTPVILMMSRDDVYDEARARQSSIVDHIAKPFESQELISKVKKAVGGAVRQPQPAAAKTETQQTSSRQPLAKAAPGAGATVAKAAPKQQAPGDIFDIIKEAPTGAEIPQAVGHKRDEDVYEVEPVVEVEEPLEQEAGKALPVGKKAVEEMREGLGLRSRTQEPDISSFESFAPPETPGFTAGPEPRQGTELPVIEREAREYVPPPAEPDFSEPEASSVDARLRSIAEEIVSRIARDHFKNMPAPRLPHISEGAVQNAVEESVSKIVRETAREVIEKVAWEVIPDLAAMLIREEIERLKAET